MKVAKEVKLGSVWFVWGDHYEVIDDRPGDRVLVKGETYQEREVKLAPMNPTRRRQFKTGGLWVADWRIPKFGAPSLAYSKEEA